MPHFICATCGVQFAETPDTPAGCPVCEDERQFVPHTGQRWTTSAELSAGHRIELEDLEPGLTALAVLPTFAIGQRPLLVRSDMGNVLWDCTALVDAVTVAAVERMGGIRAIAISHPHFYGSMVEWSRAFANAPILLPHADRGWVMRPDPAIAEWDGPTLELWDGISIVRCGGHFDGSSVLHWPRGAEGRGVLLTGDTIGVAADRRWATMMRSYPNEIPLGSSALAGIESALAPLDFDRIYSAWPGDVIETDAKNAVARSIQRYRTAITSPPGSEHAAEARVDP